MIRVQVQDFNIKECIMLKYMMNYSMHPLGFRKHVISCPVPHHFRLMLNSLDNIFIYSLQSLVWNYGFI